MYNPSITNRPPNQVNAVMQPPVPLLVVTQPHGKAFLSNLFFHSTRCCCIVWPSGDALPTLHCLPHRASVNVPPTFQHPIAARAPPLLLSLTHFCLSQPSPPLLLPGHAPSSCPLPASVPSPLPSQCVRLLLPQEYKHAHTTLISAHIPHSTHHTLISTSTRVFDTVGTSLTSLAN